MASPLANDPNDYIWNATGAFEDESVPFCCGDGFTLRFRRSGPEIQFTTDEDSDLWDRWSVKEDNVSLMATPELPELSVLCEPESDFRVVPEASTRVFIEIPITVSVHANGQKLCELPTETLSHTWFGELEAGELCYWISTAAQTSPPGESAPANHVIAPVIIENRSTENLEISRICLRTDGLRIYSQAGMLWASETRLRYEGGSNSSRVKIVEGPPPEATHAKLVTGARDTAKSGFVAKTFRSLRQWTANTFDD